MEFPKLYTSLAKYYDRVESQYRDHKKETEWLAHLFKANEIKTLIDVSCGTGTHLEDFAKKNAFERIVALDASKEMLEIARGKFSPTGNQMIIRGDFLCLPIKPSSFDAAVCLYWSVAGLDEGQVCALFHDVNSILYKGGLFIFDVENSEGIKQNLIGSPFVDAHFKDEKEDSTVIRVNLSELVEKDVVDWRSYYLIEDRKSPELVTDRMKLRFYSRRQLESILVDNGFGISEVLSGPGEPYRENSFSLYLVAKKI